MADKVVSELEFSSNTCGLSNLYWSEDHKISLTTDYGVNILNLCSSPHEENPSLNFQQYHVPIEKDVNTFDIGINRKDALKTLGIAQEVVFVADKTLTPKEHAIQSSESTIGSNIKGFCKAVWSPVGVGRNAECILAALTVDHRLHLCYAKDSSGNIKKVIDVSGLFYQHHKKDNFAQLCSGSRKNIHRTYTEILHNLAAVDLCWSHIMTSESESLPKKFLILFVVTKAGGVVCWQLDVPLTAGEAPKLVKLGKVSKKPPSSCCWCQTDTQKGFLSIGYHDGTASGLPCTFDEKGQVGFGESFDIWPHADRLACTNMLWKNEESTLYIVKANFLLKCEVHENKVTPSHTPLVQFGMQIVGLNHAVNNTTVVASQDMEVNMYLHDHGQTGVVQLPKEAKPHKCQGLALSRNGHFLGILHSPASAYNHLKIKCPMKLTVMSLQSSEEACDILMRDENDNIMVFADILEDLRRQCLNKQPLPSRLDQLLGNTEQWHSLSSFKQKLIRFFLVVLRNVHGGNKEKYDSLTVDLNQIERIILNRHIQHCLACNEGKGNLTTEITVQNLMAAWLHVDGSEMLPEDLTEKCVMCNADILPLRCMELTCPNGHRFFRCSKTLLLCQEVKYRRCFCCKVCALSKTTETDSSWLREILASNYCTMCDGLLI